MFVEALSNLDQSFTQEGDMPLSLHVNTKAYFSQAEKGPSAVFHWDANNSTVSLQTIVGMCLKKIVEVAEKNQKECGNLMNRIKIILSAESVKNTKINV